MMWNIAGWLSFGFVLNHAHTHGGGNYCEMIFCSCTVEEGESICTCHHQGIHEKEHLHTQDHENTCYFSVPHTEKPSTTQALIVLMKFQAFHSDEQDLDLPNTTELLYPQTADYLASGIQSDLFRPPQI